MTSVGLVSVMAMVVVASVVTAMVKPGNERFVAKSADVLRHHHGGFIVQPLEDWYFTRAARFSASNAASATMPPTAAPASSATCSDHR